MKHDATTLYTVLADLMPFVMEDYFPDAAMPDFKKAVEAACDAIGGAPVKALSGACPLVLYFETEGERRQFIEAVQDAKPNMRTCQL